MLFPSITFLFYFLPLFAVLYCAAPGITAKNVVLLALSLAHIVLEFPLNGLALSQLGGAIGQSVTKAAQQRARA